MWHHYVSCHLCNSMYLLYDIHTSEICIPSTWESTANSLWVCACDGSIQNNASSGSDGAIAVKSHPNCVMKDHRSTIEIGVITQCAHLSLILVETLCSPMFSLILVTPFPDSTLVPLQTTAQNVQPPNRGLATPPKLENDRTQHHSDGNRPPGAPGTKTASSRNHGGLTDLTLIN